MITETNKWRVILDSPWLNKDEIIYDKLYDNPHIDPDDYPHLFSPVYQLEDGTEACFGDLVWRSKNYQVKSVKFECIHIEQKTPIFGTRENCEKWLETNAENIRTELLKQNQKSSFQTLKMFIKKLDVMEELSWKELRRIREGLNNCISNIENI